MSFLYPEHLLPSKTKYDSFKYCLECFLCHWCVSKDDMCDEDNELQADAIEVERLFDYSNNIIGCNSHKNALSKIEDIIIKVEDSNLSRTPYTGDDSLVPQIKDIESSLDKERGCFFVQIRDIEFYADNYPFNISNKKQVERMFIIGISHAPSIINLYHFEFRVYNDKGLIRYKGSEWQNKIAHSIRNLILDNYKLTL